MGLIFEGIEAIVQIFLDPGANSALLQLQVNCNLGNAPSCCREAHHFQAITDPSDHGCGEPVHFGGHVVAVADARLYLK